ncbi:hypothetical protein [Micromonospora yangpuensis]|uniref:Secreted protein n=1 Tax=Micromonospora yangpuensis TaxID=683228 RepID=A0A1C6V1Z8_9ACTN|nr:hypothetical protein [Micromonospora yangpuensis]GGL98207.1 hypothetical protein GCM10012279_14580 [Micromonospora yangpuensis]SCL60349.1 hypothetical protein GA0070617_4353 [Micromonospora yangpuensis]
MTATSDRPVVVARTATTGEPAGRRGPDPGNAPESPPAGRHGPDTGGPPESPRGPDPAGPPAGRGSRYAAAVLVLGLTLAVGFAAGRSGGPAGAPTGRAAPAAGAAHLGHAPGGLEVSRDGYTLALQTTGLTVGRPGELVFRITDPTGQPVTAFQVTHERTLHLIVVGRDLTGYRHLHPEMAPDGTWRTTLTPGAAGPLRVIADFWPVGAPAQVTLGADLPVPGRYVPRPPQEQQETVVVDGYTVTLDGGLRPGESNQLLVWLGRDGQPVNDLQPHLGAYGHLVALRHGDLAYLHVHPAAASQPSSVVAFAVQVPAAGTYRLFFEFRHRDEVRTVGFTLTA